MEPRPISVPLAAALVVLGVVLAAGPAFVASFTICGISGCSGGGFGRSTNPRGCPRDVSHDTCVEESR